MTKGGPMPLEEYVRKRSFAHTPEPKPSAKTSKPSASAPYFCVQRHDATRLHYDFRLEIDRVLKSWAIPKGPSLDPAEKRLAMPTEDHPIEYLTFEGAIPEGNYGAGEMRIWDKGTYKVIGGASAEGQLENEKLMFVLNGKKLRGEFHLFRFRSSREENAWLLIKIDDEFAISGWTLEQLLPYGAKTEKPREEKAVKKVIAKSKIAGKKQTITPKSKPEPAVEPAREALKKRIAAARSAKRTKRA